MATISPPARPYSSLSSFKSPAKLHLRYCHHADLSLQPLEGRLLLSAAHYAVTDLGTFAVSDINASGQIVGSTPAGHIEIYQTGHFTDLGDPNDPGDIGGGLVINSSGTVVISANYYANGSWHDIPKLPGQNFLNFSNAINDSGTVVGEADLTITLATAFLFANGATSELPAPSANLDFTYATAINNNGQIIVNGVGQGGSTTVTSHTYLYSNGAFQEIIPDQNSAGNAINTQGDIAGTLTFSDSSTQAFLYSNGTLTIIGPASLQSQATDINDSGTIVGHAYELNGQVAAVSDNNDFIDLNTLIDPTLGWALTDAYAINASGQIIGTGTLNGEDHSFLLTPVTPAPATQLTITPVTSSVATQHLPAITVKVLDAKGNLASDSNASVTLSLAGSSTSALSGTLTVQALNGLATFSDLTLTKAGKYTLTAKSTALKSISTPSFTITPDLDSAHISILSTPPATIAIGAVLPPLTVSFFDQFGNIIPSSTSAFIDEVTGPNGLKNIGGSRFVTFSNGIATFKNTIFLAAGTYSVGIDNFPNISSVAQFPITVTPATTTLAAPKPSSSYIFGSTITLSSTLKSTAPTSIPFTGTVTLVDQNNNTLATTNVATNGSFKFSLTTPTPAIYLSTIQYAGDDNHTAVISAPITLTINKAATKTTITPSTTSPVFGQSVTFNIAVTTSIKNAAARTGTVAIFDGLTQIGTADLTNASSAQFTTALLTPISHPLTAVYSGDTNYLTATSSKLNLTIKKTNTHIILTPLAPITLLPGQLLNLSATVIPIAPGSSTLTGLVTFKDGGKTIGFASPDSSGVATVTLSLPTAGKHSITATYAGDTFSNSSTSPSISQTIIKASTTTALPSLNSTSPAGQNITLTAAVTATDPAIHLPTGNLIFKDGAKTLATVPLIAGVATWTSKTPLALGSHLIAAFYQGDSNDLPSFTDQFTITFI